jgi:hypothetical protein
MQRSSKRYSKGPSTPSIKSKEVDGSGETLRSGSRQEIKDNARLKQARDPSKRQNDVPPLFIVREEEENIDATPMLTGTRENMTPYH